MENVLAILEEAHQPKLADRYKSLAPPAQGRLAEQIIRLNQSYPGGLKTYVQRARKLLQNSKDNVNPYEGYVPSVPQGYAIDFQGKEIYQLEANGLKVIRHTAFVLVAGGLGQRLGYQGIKVELPVQLMTGKCFLQYYIEFLLQYQRRYFEGEKVQLAIMTSEDTRDKTVQLLEKNGYFGMEKGQVTIMMQEKVPAMLNNDGEFAFDPETGLIDTKPHGHGDVHTLLYQHQLTMKWLKADIRYVVFFQDTNPLIFRALPTVLGVSKTYNLKVNSVTVPRRPGEAVGAIMKLKGPAKELTINVQYNQLESLLSKFGGEAVNSEGYSLYPGNINVLVFQLKDYARVLQGTKGNIDQFINPKYKDKDKKEFKSATRLECMMQDYPKLLESGKGVGFTQLDRFFCFSTVKNDIKSAAEKAAQQLPPESASSCEADLYQLNRKLIGPRFKIAQHEPVEFEGIPLKLYPRVYISPRFGLSLDEIIEKIRGSNSIEGRGELIIDDPMPIKDLKVGSDQRVIIRDGKVTREKRPELAACTPEDSIVYRMRGYKQMK